MKVLLLHPEDRLLPEQSRGWDLILDLGRSPAQVYEHWSRQAACRVVSLYDYSRGFDDLYRLKPSVELGNGVVEDRYGIDWWDVAFPMLLPDMEQCCMLLGVAKELSHPSRLFCSRPDGRAFALANYLGVECHALASGSSVLSRFRHYKHAIAQLDFEQLKQVGFDKFDSEHRLRRRLAGKSPVNDPVFLLPTAYVNVSYAAVGYASLLPDQRFLLAVARPGGKLASLPKNVRMISLDAYFEGLNREELLVLTRKWESLMPRLDTPEFRMAAAAGVLQRGPGIIRRGLAARDAWIRLFESVDILGCLSADDVNAYTSLPIFIARQRNIPTIAVHHGALDGRTAVKPIVADHYIAKGELERDYLVETCRVERTRIAVGSGPLRATEPVKTVERPWIVFFTEPYGSAGWRMEDVYRQLLPELCELAARTKLKLVFKTHPFESIRGHRNLVRKVLRKDQLAEISWVAGRITDQLWNRTRFAISVESTITLECALRQIPIFLCGWLQHVYGGYVQQYAKFEAGIVLNSPDEIRNVPQLLANWTPPQVASDRIWSTIESGELLSLLNGSRRKTSTIPIQSFRPDPSLSKW
jgi:hypothetical protein